MSRIIQSRKQHALCQDTLIPNRKQGGQLNMLMPKFAHGVHQIPVAPDGKRTSLPGLHSCNDSSIITYEA
jgi:hypothetical protein